MQRDAGALVGAIYEAAWHVRNLSRPHQVTQQAQAIERLGVVVREAFTSSSDFAPLLHAVADSLVTVPTYHLAIPPRS